MSGHRARLGAATLAGLIVLALMTVWSGAVGPGVPADPRIPEARSPMAPAHDALEAISRHPIDGQVGILVVEGLDTPISFPSARMIEDGQAARGAIDIAGDSVTGDGDGRIALDPTYVGKNLLVFKSGYVSTRVFLDRLGEHKVVLGRSETLEVQCLAENLPRAGCLVAVSAGEVVPAAAALTLADAADGDPAARRPLWTRRTGKDGLCRFDLPVGRRWRVSVFHDECYPAEEWALGGQDVTVPAGRMVIPMHEMYAVMAAIPTNETIRDYFWNIDHNRRSNEIGSLARAQYCASRLKRRFPGAVATALRPKGVEREMVASIAALASDGTAWSLTWPYQPIRAISAPAYMNAVEGPDPASVTVLLLVDGVRIDGIPMRLVGEWEDRPDLIVATISGEEIRVPSGRYWAETKVPVPWMDDPPRPEGLVVTSKFPAVISVAMPKLVHCRVAPSIEGDLLNRKAIISFRGNGASMTSVWEEEIGALDLWLSPGEYTVDASASGYAPVSTSIVVPADVKRMEWRGPVLSR